MPKDEGSNLDVLLAGLAGGAGGSVLGSDLARQLTKNDAEILKRLGTAPRGRLGAHQVLPIPFVMSAQRGRLAREAGKLTGGDIKGGLAGFFAPSYLNEKVLKGREGSLSKLKPSPNLGAVADVFSWVGPPGGGFASPVHRGMRQAQVLKMLGEKHPKLKGLGTFLGIPWGMNALRRGLAKEELAAVTKRQRIGKGLKYGLPVGAAALAAGLASALMGKDDEEDQKKASAQDLERDVLTLGIMRGLRKLSAA